MTQQAGRKVRDDLTAEEKARLEKYGTIEFKSTRPLDYRSHETFRFIPSRDQH
jgi:hypothetical protein